jgi:hypothetical protein
MKRAALLSLGLMATLCACRRHPKPEAMKPEIAVASDAAPPPPAAEVAPPTPRVPRAPVPPCSAGPSPSLKETQRVATSGDAIVVFVASDTTKEGPEADLLCIVRDGGTPAVLLVGHQEAPEEGMEKHLGGFDNLVLTADQRTLYFKSEAWAVEDALHAIDLATGKRRFVHAGHLATILDKGPWKGMLLIGTMELDDQHPIGSPQFTGRGAVMRVVSTTGKNVKRLPNDRAAMVRMLGTDIGLEE